MLPYIDKIKSKKGGTHIIEILICTPIIICVLFLPLALYQISQQQNYIEDIKTMMLQEMSRDGDLTSAEITGKWKPMYEKFDGVTIKSITPIEIKVLRESKTPIVSTITANLKPSIFSFLIGGDYSTKAIIYSEYVP